MKVQIELSSEDFATLKPLIREGETISSVCTALVQFAIPDAVKYIQEMETEKEQQKLSKRDTPFLRRNIDYTSSPFAHMNQQRANETLLQLRDRLNKKEKQHGDNK